MYLSRDCGGAALRVARLSATSSIIALLACVSPGQARDLPGQSPRDPRVISCTVENDSKADPVDASDDASDDDDDDDASDTDDDATSEDSTSDAGGKASKKDEAIPGFLASDGVTCIGMSGSVSSGTKVQKIRQPNAWERKNPSDNFGHSTSFSLTLDTSTPSGDSYLTTGLTMGLDAAADPTLSRAVIGWGPWQFGYDASQFTFWDGGEFAGAALNPQQSSTQIMRRHDFTDTIYGTLSMESFATQGSGGGAQSTTPRDAPPSLVAALGFDGDKLEAKASVLARQAWTDSNMQKRSEALAVNAGATWSFSDRTTATLQGTVSSNAPEVLGTRFERRTISDLGVQGQDTFGWSWVASTAYAVSDEVTANAYVSYFRFRLASPASSGNATSWRVAANLTWEPLENFTLALEAGANALENRLAPPRSPSNGNRRAGTLTFTIQRTF